MTTAVRVNHTYATGLYVTRTRTTACPPCSIYRPRAQSVRFKSAARHLDFGFPGTTFVPPKAKKDYDDEDMVNPSLDDVRRMLKSPAVRPACPGRACSTVSARTSTQSSHTTEDPEILKDNTAGKETAISALPSDDSSLVFEERGQQMKLQLVQYDSNTVNRQNPFTLLDLSNYEAEYDDLENNVERVLEEEQRLRELAEEAEREQKMREEEEAEFQLMQYEEQAYECDWEQEMLAAPPQEQPYSSECNNKTYGPSSCSLSYPSFPPASSSASSSSSCFASSSSFLSSSSSSYSSFSSSSFSSVPAGSRTPPSKIYGDSQFYLSG